MGKPSDELRTIDAGDTPRHAEVAMDHAAALLDECERVIQQYVNDLEFGVSADSKPRRIEYARATLAKLRGEK